MKMSKALVVSFALILSIIVFSGAALGVTWDVVNGRLMGASGVNVSGTYYDVAFTDGSCFSLFGGCDPSRFAFRSSQEALTAAKELYNQVLLDIAEGAFDTNPGLVNGITGYADATLKSTAILTPYEYNGDTPAGRIVWVAVTINQYSVDYAYAAYSVPATWDSSWESGSYYTYAVWSPAGGGAQLPEPATILLLASGLVGIGVVRRKLKVR